MPTDFSAAAAKAFDFACQLAKKFDASIKLIHVYRSDFGMPVPESMAYQMLEARKDDAQRKMESFLKSKDRAIKIESIVEMVFHLIYWPIIPKVKKRALIL